MKILIHGKNLELTGALKQYTESKIEKATNPDNVVFVMDAAIGQACEAQATAFSKEVSIAPNIIELDMPAPVKSIAVPPA